QAAVADPQGNVYVGDFNDYRVRKIDTSGNVTTVGGTGTNGVTGNGGPATQANMRSSWQLALDRNNNLYSADGTASVRKIDLTTGLISTPIGIATTGFSGDG